jgi:YHS domain-containing protein
VESGGRTWKAGSCEKPAKKYLRGILKSLPGSVCYLVRLVVNKKGNEMIEVMRKSGAVVLFAVVLVPAVGAIYGGQKGEPAKIERQAATFTASEANGVIEQKTCPVLGNPIDKNIYTEYKGKKVYFCCSMCKPEFEKNPEKYIGKLPQFAK